MIPIAARFLLGLFLHGLLLMSCREPAQTQSDISSAVVYSIQYTVERTTAIEPNLLVNGFLEASDTVIQERVILQWLDSAVKSYQQMKGDTFGLDARIVCLLGRQNSKNDTLSFGGPTMCVNHSCFDIDTSIVKVVANYLPEDQRDGFMVWLRDYGDVRRKYRKR
jgi:hypothetical protein